MIPSRALVLSMGMSVVFLSGCTLNELSHPMSTLKDVAYPGGPPQVLENPSTRNVFYGAMPRNVTLEWVMDGHESEPRAAVESRMRQIESVVKSQLQNKGYNVQGALHGGASTDAELVRVQVDYESSPTMAVGGRGRDHSVSVACVQGEDTLGSATCRWINHESGDIDGILNTLVTQAAAKIPAAEKVSAKPADVAPPPPAVEAPAPLPPAAPPSAPAPIPGA